MTSYAEELRSRASGFLICHRSFMLVIFPPYQDSWNFLTLKHPPSQHAMLRFHIRTPPHDYELMQQSSLILNESGATDVEVVFRQLFDIDTQKLFDWNGGLTVDKNAFLMFPPRREDEIWLVTRFLQAAGAKVYHGGDSGSWDYFRKHTKSGLILVCRPL